MKRKNEYPETPTDIKCAEIIKRIASENAELIILAASPTRCRQSPPLTLNVSVKEIESSCRKAEFVIVRHVAIGIMKKLTKMTLFGIGRQFKGLKKGSTLDHSTICNAIDKMDENNRLHCIGFYKVYKLMLEKCRVLVDAEKVNMTPEEKEKDAKVKEIIEQRMKDAQLNGMRKWVEKQEYARC